LTLLSISVNRTWMQQYKMIKLDQKQIVVIIKKKQRNQEGELYDMTSQILKYIFL
jgi:hypothetical protein